MKDIFMGIKYEFFKLIYDKERIKISLITVLSVLFITFFITNFFVGRLDSDNASKYIPWTQEIEDKYITLKENAYTDYLINIGKLDPEGPYAYTDPESCLKKYKYYSFILENKNLNYYDGYSINNMLLDSNELSRNSQNITATKLLLFQNISFVLLLIIPAISIYFIFVRDKAENFERHFPNSINKRKLYLGKIIISFLAFTLIYLVFFSLGFIYLSDTSVLIYSFNEYSTISILSLYLERALEMYLGLVVFYIIFIILGLIFNNQYIYLTCSIIISLFYYPSLISVFKAVASDGDINISHMYLWNIISSNGFNDQFFQIRILEQVITIVILLIVYVITFIISTNKNRKPFKLIR